MDIPQAVERSRQGDQAAFRVLFEVFYPQAYRATYLVTRNSDLAQEATQEAFIKAFTHLGELQKPERFGAWLRVIATRSAVDVLRREKAYLASENLEEVAAGEDNVLAGFAFQLPEEAGERAELRQAVMRALATLDVAQQEVIVLRYYHQFTDTEIAQALGCPLGTVKSRLHRGMQALARRLAAYQPGKEGELHAAKR